MFQEPGGLPLAGGMVLAGLIYAGISLFVTGPVIGERMIARSNWGPRCAAGIQAGARREEPAVPQLPNVGCMELFGGWFGRAGAEYCGVHGHLFENNPVNKALGAARDARRRAQQKRMDYAASNATSRCECAVTTTLEARRIPLALYAGTLRLVTPPPVRRLDSDLKAALNAPGCAMKGSQP